ncbi:hypothetical protein ACJX0J_007169 [Zea mays]
MGQLALGFEMGDGDQGSGVAGVRWDNVDQRNFYIPKIIMLQKKWKIGWTDHTLIIYGLLLDSSESQFSMLFYMEGCHLFASSWGAIFKLYMLMLEDLNVVYLEMDSIGIMLAGIIKMGGKLVDHFSGEDKLIWMNSIQCSCGLALSGFAYVRLKCHAYNTLRVRTAVLLLDALHALNLHSSMVEHLIVEARLIAYIIIINFIPKYCFFHQIEEVNFLRILDDYIGDLWLVRATTLHGPHSGQGEWDQQQNDRKALWRTHFYDRCTEDISERENREYEEKIILATLENLYHQKELELHQKKANF